MKTDALSLPIDSLPQIQKYISVTQYLQDIYHYRKAQDVHFSYEIWATELGFKSRSSVRQICYGRKNITPAFVKALASSIGLNVQQQEHFLLIASYQNAKTPILKKACLDKIRELVDFTGNRIEIDHYADFLSSPALPILQLLVSFVDFTATEKQIKDTLLLDKADVSKNLKLLKKLDLIEDYYSEKQAEPVWKTKMKHFKILSDMQDEVVKVFHQQATLEANRILDMHIKDKKFRSLYFSMTSENFQEFSEDMEQFIIKMKNKYGNDYIQNKSLYKINFQAFPVTEVVQSIED